MPLVGTNAESIRAAMVKGEYTPTEQQLVWRRSLQGELQSVRKDQTGSEQALQRAMQATGMLATMRALSGRANAAQLEQQMQAAEAEAASSQQAQGVPKALTRRQKMQYAKKFYKEYEMRMHLLHLDLNAEGRGISSWLFNPVALTGFAASDTIDMLNLGTFWTIINWIIYLIMPIILFVRLWKYAAIRYGDPKRAIRRRIMLMKRGIGRNIVRIMATLGEWIPFVSFIPWGTIVQASSMGQEYRDQINLRTLKNAHRIVDRRVKRLWARARTPEARYSVATIGLKLAKGLEKHFDELP